MKVNNEIIQKINELYPTYLNLKRVGEELGISGNTVKKYLNEQNLNIVKQRHEDRDALFYYIYHLFGEENEMPVSAKNLTLMQRFASQGIDYKAQLFTLKWYYEVCNNPVKKEYKTIGIIPHIIDKAAHYYRTKEQERIKMEEAIKKQLQQDRITVKYNPNDYIGKRKKKKIIDLNLIVGEKNDKN